MSVRLFDGRRRLDRETVVAVIERQQQTLRRRLIEGSESYCNGCNDYHFGAATYGIKRNRLPLVTLEEAMVTLYLPRNLLLTLIACDEINVFHDTYGLLPNPRGETPLVNIAEIRKACRRRVRMGHLNFSLKK